MEATLDRRAAIADADYVISTIRQGGLEAFQTDVDIPLKYGVDQCVGDNYSVRVFCPQCKVEQLWMCHLSQNLPLTLVALSRWKPPPDILLLAHLTLRNRYARYIAQNRFHSHSHLGMLTPRIGLRNAVEGKPAHLADVAVCFAWHTTTKFHLDLITVFCASGPKVCVTRWWVGRDNAALTEPA